MGRFNTQSPEGGCHGLIRQKRRKRGFNTQSPEGGWPCVFRLMPCCKCFNTQSPEGGCQCNHFQQHEEQKFQHTAARRRLLGDIYRSMKAKDVSTHSRPKAAASIRRATSFRDCSFNTQPPEGGCLPLAPDLTLIVGVSTHSRPKAAAVRVSWITKDDAVSTHSRPKAAAANCAAKTAFIWFQHTAARRRLLH